MEDALNYVFLKADITRAEEISRAFETYQPDGIIHLAAESHVDRSITDPMAVVNTNVLGTVNLLNAERDLWKSPQTDAQTDGHQTPYINNRFYNVSTDEVYGVRGDPGLFTEGTPVRKSAVWGKGGYVGVVPG